MNCLEAQALVSAAHDGESVPEADLAAARVHCETCEECAAFVAGLKWLDVMPVPPAPKGLVDRVLAAVEPLEAQRAEALALEAEREEAASLGLELPVPDGAEAPEDPAPSIVTPAPAPWSRFEWFQGPTKWASLGAAAALAATALIAFVVVGVGGNSGTPARTTVTARDSGAAPEASFGSAAQKAGSADGAQPTVPAPSQAPDYVLYRDFVYSPGALLADANSATPTIGTLSTAFASGGGPSTVTVYRSPLTDGSIVVKGSDGMRLYSPVVRLLSSVRYQLTSGKPIDSFGVWPVLPTRFPVPANADGTPSFVAAGNDALGVKVHAATGRPVTEGFALGPETAGSDPAAGNPNWTWWAPAPPNP